MGLATDAGRHATAPTGVTLTAHSQLSCYDLHPPRERWRFWVVGYFGFEGLIG